VKFSKSRKWVKKFYTSRDRKTIRRVFKRASSSQYPIPVTILNRTYKGCFIRIVNNKSSFPRFEYEIRPITEYAIRLFDGAEVIYDRTSSADKWQALEDAKERINDNVANLFRMYYFLNKLK
jgi:hypothetical protein